MTNTVDWVSFFFGAMRIGAVLIPINTWLKADEIGYILRKAGAQHLVMQDRFRQVDFTDLLAEIVPEWVGARAGDLHSAGFPRLRNVVVLRRSPDRQRQPNAIDYEDLLAEPGEGRELADQLAQSVRPTDLGFVMFSSGSTGFPKGVMLEQWGLVTNGLLHSRRLGVTEHDRYFSSMPFFHAGGCIWGLMTVVSQGATLVFTEANDGRLAAELLERERCTINFVGPSPIYYGMAAALEDHPRRFDSIWLGIAADPDLYAAFRKIFGVTNFLSPYGMTELYGAAILTGREDSAGRQQGGWGKPLDGVELRLVDPETGLEVPPGSIGEICLRGLVMRGYYDLPDETSSAIDAKGWMHTLDLGVMDEQGYVRYVGRIKAMLKVGGESVAAEEVEAVVRQFPGVAEAAVIGVPNRRMGELPRAYVVQLPKAEVDVGELRAWCSHRLARFKVPADFIVVEALPMTGSNKVDRAALVRMDRGAGADNVN